MSFKDKLVNIVISHSKLVTFGIGVTVTLVIGAMIGIINDPTHTANAISQSQGSEQSSGDGGR